MAALLAHRRTGPGSIPGLGTLAEIVNISQKRSPPGIEPATSRLEDPRAAAELISNIDGEEVSLIFLSFSQNRQPDFLMSKFS